MASTPSSVHARKRRRSVSKAVSYTHLDVYKRQLFGLADAGEDDPGLWTAVANMLPTLSTKLSFLAFNLLCAPCFAAIGAIKREMASAKWTAFAIGYQCVFAYCVALMIYQFGMLFSGAGFTVGTVAAIILLVLTLFLLFLSLIHIEMCIRDRPV